VRVVRVTTEILGPVPVGEVTVDARVVRPGRRVELLEATLKSDGRTALRAHAWRMATAVDGPPAVDRADGPPALPPPGPQPDALPGVDGFAYLHAVEWRFVTGAFDSPGPAQVWTRLRHPLVAGEEPTGLCRVLAVADSGNGVSSELDIGRWLFINTDLTVLLHRDPADDWICLEARTTIDASGTGMAESVLSDRDGHVGRGLQSLLVSPREHD
jgi:hypothetical protein